MKAAAILDYIVSDGLALLIDDDGNLEITGSQNTIDCWMETIRENKAAILAELRRTAAQQPPLTERSDSGRYSVIVADASTDPVLAEVTIRGLASFIMAIPRAHYDGIALLFIGFGK